MKSLISYQFILRERRSHLFTKESIYLIMCEENKNNYRRILDLTILNCEELKNTFPEINIYALIYEQLKSIKKRVITNKEILTREEIFNEYNFGSIAAKNFDNSSFGENLMFLYGLSYKYAHLPEN